MLVGGIHTADVAYANGAPVVIGTVCSNLCYRAARVNGAVAVNDVVISYITESPLQVPLPYLFGCDVAPFGRGGTVDDDFSDGSHFLGGVFGVCYSVVVGPAQSRLCHRVGAPRRKRFRCVPAFSFSAHRAVSSGV